mgnify:CR=1 FL=1
MGAGYQQIWAGQQNRRVDIITGGVAAEIAHNAGQWLLPDDLGGRSALGFPAAEGAD